MLVDLLPVGAPRRDWRATVIGDGMVVVRHPELQRVIEMTEASPPTCRCTPVRPKGAGLGTGGR